MKLSYAFAPALIALASAAPALAGELESVLEAKLSAQVTENLDRRVYDKAQIRGVRLGQDPKLNEMSARQTVEHEMPMDYRELNFRVALSGPDNRTADYKMKCTLGITGLPGGIRNLNVMWCNPTNAKTGKKAEEYELAHFWSQDRVLFQDRGVPSDAPAKPVARRPNEDGPRFPKDIN
jgi:hypothetical protein